MSLLASDPDIEIVAASGIFRVAIRRKLNWLSLLGEMAIVAVFTITLYRHWTGSPLLVRIVLSWAALAAVASLFFQSSGEEILEFDERKLTITKGIHGWERKREYKIDDCSELEWVEGSKGQPRGLRCKSGWKMLQFGGHLSEEQSIEILAALQRNLPDVAQRICSSPDDKSHFITMKLS